MNEKFLRTYYKFDLKDIQDHVLIYGDISAQCGKCQAVDLKLEDHQWENVRQNLNILPFVMSEIISPNCRK